MSESEEVIGKLLLSAAKGGDTNTVISLLRDNPNIDVNYRKANSYYMGSTALHYAAEYGHTEVCRILLSNSNIDINAKDNYEWTALHWAAYRGRTECCRVLLSNSNMTISAMDNGGRTAL